jgi:hypothetical protein
MIRENRFADADSFLRAQAACHQRCLNYRVAIVNEILNHTGS